MGKEGVGTRKRKNLKLITRGNIDDDIIMTSLHCFNPHSTASSDISDWTREEGISFLSPVHHTKRLRKKEPRNDSVSTLEDGEDEEGEEEEEGEGEGVEEGGRRKGRRAAAEKGERQRKRRRSRKLPVGVTW